MRIKHLDLTLTNHSAVIFNADVSDCTRIEFGPSGADIYLGRYERIHYPIASIFRVEIRYEDDAQ